MAAGVLPLASVGSSTGVSRLYWKDAEYGKLDFAASAMASRSALSQVSLTQTTSELSLAIALITSGRRSFSRAAKTPFEQRVYDINRKVGGNDVRTARQRAQNSMLVAFHHFRWKFRSPILPTA